MRYYTADCTRVLLDDGRIVPVDLGNVDYRDIVASGAYIGPYIEPPAAVPPSLTRVQFFTQAAMSGIISQDDALAAVTGTLPATFDAFIAALPANQQFPARVRLAGSQEFRRDHPMVAQFAAFTSMSDAQVDDFFRTGALI